MSKRTFCNCSCNCHWSRQVSYMRHCWNKIFLAIIRVIVVINQIVIMSPFIYLKNSQENFISIAPKPALQFARVDYPIKLAVKWKFRTHRLLTVAAIILLTCYAILSPFMVKLASELYSRSRRNHDNLFITVAKFTMTIDTLGFLFVMATNIRQREKIVRTLNLFNETICRFEQLEKNLIGFKTFLALTFKTALAIYQLVATLPHVVTSAPRLSTQVIVGFLFTHYLSILGCVFELNMFTFVLLFLTCSLQLEKELQCEHVTVNDLRVSQLISLQDALQRVVALFRSTFQFGIFLMILLYFVSILSNIYAMLDFYVSTHVLFGNFITHMLCLAVELYSLIYVAYLFDRSQRKVKDLFLQREELYFLKHSNSLSVLVTDVLWPQLNELQLLGLFTLNNKLALFLFNYSINFIVIILEFEINKAHK